MAREVYIIKREDAQMVFWLEYESDFGEIGMNDFAIF